MELRYIAGENSKRKIVKVRDVSIGDGGFDIIAGPCSVEALDMLLETSGWIKAYGAVILRGGAFKPRTSPYTFQGLKEEGLKHLKQASIITGLPVVSEIMDPRDMELIYGYVDMFQIGSRNMQNFSLLKEVGKADKPVLLKRGMAATIEDFLMAAEYIASEGNDNIVLCERGIRTFENYTRNTLDITAVPILKSLCKLPVIVDPSHGTGRRDLILPMSLAAMAAGADGVMIEVHPCPENALSDGEQSLNLQEFKEIAGRLKSTEECFCDIRKK
ncbi:MAG TPA: 3-deoxy-7-phosphoheptulonate synthase [Clostridia bacterium]|nr:3-deoxy-7-phosphoheptulonate synthase [Clostridia bacterium]